MNRKCGIYIIRHEPTGRFYVGSSINISQRWREHRYQLRHNKHKNPHLQASWNKYGEQAFIFIIIEECDPTIIIEREQYYLDQHEWYYNQNLQADRVTHTDEVREKIAAANRRRVITDETRKRNANSQKARARVWPLNGIMVSAAELAILAGCEKRAMLYRLKTMTPEEAVAGGPQLNISERIKRAWVMRRKNKNVNRV